MISKIFSIDQSFRVIISLLYFSVLYSAFSGDQKEPPATVQNPCAGVVLASHPHKQPNKCNKIGLKKEATRPPLIGLIQRNPNISRSPKMMRLNKSSQTPTTVP
ncbi:hypothetical protein CIPAW_05G090900 [Carya illinoinensis]|uniref:Uncharacterized protein n=1 Tax=Carya illinoinensis TaxID=32201 RepID=A0A8T1QGG7_CARIL|nr:hypothetical protein CIPAW_05G090900 [Carya illinoinensis]